MHGDFVYLQIQSSIWTRDSIIIIIMILSKIKSRNITWLNEWWKRRFKNTQQPLPVDTYWFRAANHDDLLLLSALETDRLRFDREYLINSLCMSRSTERGIKQGLVSGAPMQRLELIFIDRNFWQLTLRKEEPSGEFREQDKSGLQRDVVSWVESATSPEHEQNDRDKLVLASSLIGLVSGSISNDTIPCRQRGQGIDPMGPLVRVAGLLVELRQKYRAHCVQNSWSQPAPCVEML